MLKRPVVIAILSVLVLGIGPQARALTPQQVSSYLEASNKGCTLTSTFPGVVGRVRGSDREVTVVRYGIEGCGGGNNHGTPLAVLYDAGGARVAAFENRLPLGEVSAVAIRNGVIVANMLEFAPSGPALLPEQERQLPRRRHREPTYHAPLSVRLPSSGFAFLTTEPNAVVAPIHPKAIPVLLTTAEEYDTWLTAPAQKALALQRPLPDGTLTIAARGAKHDG